MDNINGCLSCNSCKPDTLFIDIYKKIHNVIDEAKAEDDFQLRNELITTKVNELALLYYKLKKDEELEHVEELTPLLKLE